MVTLERSKGVLKVLLSCLEKGGVSLDSLRHAHECFARGTLYSDRRK